jgi:hypothetical protein
VKEIMAYNDRVAPFDNVKVRKALARGIDKQKLLEAIWGDRGMVLGSFVPPTDPWYEDLTGVDAYDPESAKALLAEAGHPDGFTFTLETPNYDPHPITAEFIKAELAKIGVTVNINIITANEWYTKVYQAKDFQATLQEHVNHRDVVFYGNPDFYWGYDNADVTRLIAEAEEAATEDEHTAKLREANRSSPRTRPRTGSSCIRRSWCRGECHRLSAERAEFAVLPARDREVELSADGPLSSAPNLCAGPVADRGGAGAVRAAAPAAGRSGGGAAVRRRGRGADCRRPRAGRVRSAGLGAAGPLPVRSGAVRSGQFLRVEPAGAAGNPARLTVTLPLTLAAFTLALCLAVPLGIIAAAGRIAGMAR